MTKPEMTNKISTRTQPNHVKGAADGYSTSAATVRSKPGTPIEVQAHDQNIWWKIATPNAAAKRSGSSNGKWLFTGMDQVHATIPPEILKPVTGLCEVGHTRPVVVERSGSLSGFTWSSSHAPDAAQRHALHRVRATRGLLDGNRKACERKT